MNQRKIFTVENLTQKLKDAKALVLADYRGLSVAQMTKLRNQVSEAGGELEVVKNRLLGIASSQAKIKIDDQVLEGPTAVLWAWEDEIQPLKALYEFSKESDLPKIKFGIFEGEIIAPDRIVELAKLPGKNELQAKLVGALCSPSYRLVNSLSGNLRKLVYILRQEGEKVKG